MTALSFERLLVPLPDISGRVHGIVSLRLCLSCHRRFDAARRRATGRSTRPQEVMSNV